jgi:hypothetical protein
LLLPILRSDINENRKKRENTKKILKENKKNISVWKIYQNTQEIVEDWLGKIKIYKIGEFDSVFSTDKGSIGKENSIWGGKFKIGCLMTQL